VAISYRNGSEILVEWRQWRDETWAHCRYASHDKTKCSAHLCPCGLAHVSLWMNTISGYLGTVKLVKYFGRENGNGNGKTPGQPPTAGEECREEESTGSQKG
jgi:hypothetical protein